MVYFVIIAYKFRMMMSDLCTPQEQKLFIFFFYSFNMFHVFALTYYCSHLHLLQFAALRDARVQYDVSHYKKKLLDLRDARVQYDVITRAVHETCFCCRSCNRRFFSTRSFGEKTINKNNRTKLKEYRKLNKRSTTPSEENISLTKKIL